MPDLRHTNYTGFTARGKLPTTHTHRFHQRLTSNRMQRMHFQGSPLSTPYGWFSIKTKTSALFSWIFLAPHSCCYSKWIRYNPSFFHFIWIGYAYSSCCSSADKPFLTISIPIDLSIELWTMDSMLPIVTKIHFLLFRDLVLAGFMQNRTKMPPIGLKIRDQKFHSSRVLPCLVLNSTCWERKQLPSVCWPAIHLASLFLRLSTMQVSISSGQPPPHSITCYPLISFLF